MTNVCLSGGADGADILWGTSAATLGHRVIHWSFNGHKSSAPEEEIVLLTQAHLDEADDPLKRANLSLKRKFPSKSQHVNNLLRRNYYQTRWTEAIYGVSKLKDNQVEGGTAWAIQLYMDRFLCDNEDPQKCQLYLFDQDTNYWLQWNPQDRWSVLSKPPVPSGIWAGIGSRKLTDAGKAAICELMAP